MNFAGCVQSVLQIIHGYSCSARNTVQFIRAGHAIKYLMVFCAKLKHVHRFGCIQLCWNHLNVHAGERILSNDGCNDVGVHCTRFKLRGCRIHKQRAEFAYDLQVVWVVCIQWNVIKLTILSLHALHADTAGWMHDGLSRHAPFHKVKPVNGCLATPRVGGL